MRGIRGPRLMADRGGKFRVLIGKDLTGPFEVISVDMEAGMQVKSGLRRYPDMFEYESDGRVYATIRAVGFGVRTSRYPRRGTRRRK